MEFEIFEIDLSTPEYRDSLKLRELVLRRPLGLCLTDGDLQQDFQSFHIGLRGREGLIGILLLTPKGSQVFQMRQVAVLDALRGRGLGRQLVKAAERFVLQKSGAQIFLHARVSALAFYEKLGYCTIGPVASSLVMPHFMMTKNISASSDR